MEPLWFHNANVMLVNPTGLTNRNAKAKNGTSVNLPTFESDVLRKNSDGEWKLEAHSAWRVSH
jgi:ketosteroid isomerase-like protein